MVQKWQADSNSIFLLTSTVLFLFKLIRDAAKNGRRTTNLVEWTPLDRWQQTAEYGLLGPGPEKFTRMCKKTTMNLVPKLV